MSRAPALLLPGFLVAGRRVRSFRRSAALAACATLTACGAAPASDPEVTTVTILDPNYEAIFNPSWSMPARFLVFSSLLGFGEDGEVEPRLARSWERSDDRREWTFHLRSDVRWHDGAPFTARDVAFTLAIMSHPEVAYRARPDTVIVVDDSTVTVRWERPHDALGDWWWVYYPEHLLGQVEPAQFFDSDFWTQPVGTGPFRYVRHQPKTVFVLEANPDYFRGEPQVERVQIRFGGGSPALELRKGSIDGATYVSRAEIPRFREDPSLGIYYRIYPDVSVVEVLYWNHRHRFLGEAVVRRALTMAVDREELRRLQHLPERTPVFDVLFTRRQFWANALPPALTADANGARALLDSAGWRDADGDGVRERGGTEARFTALLRTDGHADEVAAVYIQAALREIGVDMEIGRLESGLVQRIRAGEFEAAFRAFDRREDPKRTWRPGSPMGYHDPELTRLLLEADTARVPAVKDSLYRLSWPILQRDLPVLFLGPEVQHFVMHRKVRGLSSPFRAHPYLALEHAWVEEE